MLLQAGVAIAFLLICGVGFLIARFTRGSFAALTGARDRLALANRQLLDQVARRESGRKSVAPGAKDGSARPAYRRHRPRLQQYARRHHGRARSRQAPHRQRRLRHRAFSRRRHHRQRARRHADAAAAGLRAAAAVVAAAARCQQNDRRHVGPAAVDFGRANPDRDRDRRRSVDGQRRFAAARERHPQHRDQQPRRHARTAAS